jgi:hypothetical protein
MKKIFDLRNAKRFVISYTDSIGFLCTVEIKRNELKTWRKVAKKVHIIRVIY